MTVSCKGGKHFQLCTGELLVLWRQVIGCSYVLVHLDFLLPARFRSFALAVLNSKTTLGDLINSILSDTTIYNTVESLVDTV